MITNDDLLNLKESILNYIVYDKPIEKQLIKVVDEIVSHYMEHDEKLIKLSSELESLAKDVDEIDCLLSKTNESLRFLSHTINKLQGILE